MSRSWATHDRFRPRDGSQSEHGKDELFHFSFFVFCENRPRRTELELAVLSLFAKLFWVKSENSVDRCVVLENFGKLSSRFQASMSSYTDGDL
jgi:hypothetical protein